MSSKDRRTDAFRESVVARISPRHARRWSPVPVDPSTDARVAFLAGLLDDAGMFPPARLPLAEAAARHADDLARRGWLLNRFLCPASRLDELAAVLPAAGDWRVGVVSDRNIDVDVPAVAAFADRFHGVVDDVEVRAGGTDPVASALAAVKVIADIPGVVAHVEVPLDERWEDVVPAFVDAVAGVTSAAVKVRCGGETPDAFPSTEQVAGVLAACHRAGVRLKATAGLHHPVRRPDAATGATMHGFFNVVIGALLLRAGVIAPDQVAAVVRETDHKGFVFTADAVGWRDSYLTPAQIQEGRATLFTGFGSCSIDEPVDDLTAMGLWPAFVA